MAMMNEAPRWGLAVLTPGVVVEVPPVTPLDGVDAPQAERSAGAPTPAKARPAAEAAPRPRNVRRSYRSAESATVPPSGRALVPVVGLSGSASTPHRRGPGPSRFL